MSITSQADKRNTRRRVDSKSDHRRNTRPNRTRTQPHTASADRRHTLATQAINRGMSLEAIAALLGHRSLDMTLRYANPRELQQLGEKPQVA